MPKTTNSTAFLWNRPTQNQATQEELAGGEEYSRIENVKRQWRRQQIAIKKKLEVEAQEKTSFWSVLSRKTRNQLRP
jgi:hypothetical protein